MNTELVEAPVSRGRLRLDGSIRRRRREASRSLVKLSILSFVQDKTVRFDLVGSGPRRPTVYETAMGLGLVVRRGLNRVCQGQVPVVAVVRNGFLGMRR